ncbi:hypothetical protein Pcinc_019968 [Petrolisthes cinctipes]|uniref:Uncharacterized protein n=1 Tax=Petrolisthes cinctipes TaxID=88211 RepID=A0AAE1KH24_PETCI|nr:hypothetical protein Pcinc_019968 [Petrolisthes cinctipes]
MAEVEWGEKKGEVMERRRGGGRKEHEKREMSILNGCQQRSVSKLYQEEVSVWRSVSRKGCQSARGVRQRVVSAVVPLDT